jgi:CheY-like chemotaxis protein
MGVGVLEKRVLLVEPYSSGRAALGAAIEELGYSLVDAATAAEGRAIVEHQPVDVVIADADDEGGRQLLLDLQARPAIGIIMLTTRPHATPLPSAVLLEKPTGIDALSQAIARSLRSR